MSNDPENTLVMETSKGRVVIDYKSLEQLDALEGKLSN